MGEKGGCHCGAVRYEIADGATPVYHAMCHCSDCRKSSGAPAVSWSLFPKETVAISGKAKSYASSEHATRSFCDQCGTSLFYENDLVFPGQIDVQSATLDNPNVFPLGVQVQTAERVEYMTHLDKVPGIERYPAPPG